MIKSILGHIKNILTHKYWVVYYGMKLNANIWCLITHDLSKFSPVEFLESIKYYQGTSSPIPICKKVNGYSEAWQHHKGRNPHHYEYWIDNYDGEMIPIKMPLKYVKEMIADWMAAGRTYQGDNFSFESQCGWWEVKRKNNLPIHPATIKVLDEFFCKDFDFDHQCKKLNEHK